MANSLNRNWRVYKFICRTQKSKRWCCYNHQYHSGYAGARGFGNIRESAEFWRAGGTPRRSQPWIQKGTRPACDACATWWCTGLCSGPATRNQAKNVIPCMVHTFGYTKQCHASVPDTVHEPLDALVSHGFCTYQQAVAMGMKRYALCGSSNSCVVTWLKGLKVLRF